MATTWLSWLNYWKYRAGWAARMRGRAQHGAPFGGHPGVTKVGTGASFPPWPLCNQKELIPPLWTPQRWPFLCLFHSLREPEVVATATSSSTPWRSMGIHQAKGRYQHRSSTTEADSGARHTFTHQRVALAAYKWRCGATHDMLTLEPRTGRESWHFHHGSKSIFLASKEEGGDVPSRGSQAVGGFL